MSPETGMRKKATKLQQMADELFDKGQLKTLQSSHVVFLSVSFGQSIPCGSVESSYNSLGGGAWPNMCTYRGNSFDSRMLGRLSKSGVDCSIQHISHYRLGSSQRGTNTATCIGACRRRQLQTPTRSLQELAHIGRSFRFSVKETEINIIEGNIKNRLKMHSNRVVVNFLFFCTLVTKMFFVHLEGNL